MSICKKQTHKISSHCRYIKGKTGSAIYDFKNQSVFSLNADATTILESFLVGNALQEHKDFIQNLLDLQLVDNDQYKEYSQTPQPKTELRYIWLELTNRCNCNCLHCYGAFGHPSKKDIESELNFDDWKEIIIQIKKLGCNSIQFIGGEPLMFPGFGELLEFAHNSGIGNIDIFTNGYFLSKELAQIIKKVGASVRVSLYGYNIESHEGITQKKGSFELLNQALDILRDMNIPTRIAVVLMKENQDYLDKIIDFIERKGHKYTGFDTVRTVQHSPQSSHAVTNPDILKERCMLSPRFHTSFKEFYRNFYWNSCWHGKFAITATGNIIPCIFARDCVCGNIKVNSAEEIKEKLLAYWRLNKDEITTCQDCEFRYACDDCRPLAMGETGDEKAKYPRCFYNPGKCTWGSCFA